LDGNVTAAPGDYPVSVAVTDDTGGVGTVSFVVKVTPEDASVAYTGDVLAYGDSVLLRATVRDNTDPTPGDVLTGNVTFSAGGQTLCTSPLHPMGTGDATGSCTAKVSGAQDVTVSVGGNYTGTTTARVETASPRAAVVVLDQSVVATGAVGVDPGSKVDASLVAAYLWPPAVGVSVVTYQSGGQRYRIVATDFVSFGARAGLVDFRANAKVYDTRGHQVAAGTVQVTARGKGLAVTLLDGDRLLLKV
jgi:hypothetical protein